MEAKAVLKNWPRITYVARGLAIAPQKVKPILTDEHLPSTVNTNKSIPIHFPLEPPQQKSFELHQEKSLESPQQKFFESQPTTQTTVLSPNDDIDIVNKNRISTPVIKTSSLMSDEIKNVNERGQSGNGIKEWFNHLTPKQKTFVKLTSIFLLIIGVTAAVLPPVYIFVLRKSNPESSFTNITASICSATTCIGQETPYRTSMVTVLYPFDGNANDLSGYATGTGFGTPVPTYALNTVYVGSGSLTLTLGSFQYIQIPYINLAQSFTIEVWLYPTNTLSGDNGIFGQCDSNSKCLLISLRNSRFVLSFDSMNTNYTLVSSTVPILAAWTHLAVVYDAVLYQQQIYVNGLLDSITTGIVTLFAGTSSGSITTIGRSLSSAYGAAYFPGRIDHLTISAGSARTACQIYNDASLLAYYPFDSTGTFNDYSVNLFQGMALGTTTISQGRIGQALYFSSSGSYFQAACYPSMQGVSAPFSISLWIKPANVTNGGSLVHVSSLQNGSGNCYDLLAFGSGGSLVVQLMQTITIVNGTQGPVVPNNTWTHVVVVFGATNGLRIYINGQLSTTSLSVLQSLNGVSIPQFVTLGNNSPLGQSAPISCRNGSIPIMPGPYQGAIDEFRLYSRELNNEEICVLAGL